MKHRHCEEAPADEAIPFLRERTRLLRQSLRSFLAMTGEVKWVGWYDMREPIVMKNLSILFLVVLLGAGCEAPPPSDEQAPTVVQQAAPTSAPAVPVMETVVLPAPTATPAPVPTAVTITNVVDGDTLDASIDGASRRVRLIGINASESGDCFAADATAELKRLVGGQKVTLEADPSQDDKDKYGRLLRYVVLADGTDVNERLIRGGFAKEYTYKVAYVHQALFRQAQAVAQAAKAGLWAVGACVAPTPTATPTPEPTPVPTPAPAPSAGSYDCSANVYNCGDFKTHAEAQAAYDSCFAKTGRDVHKLDGSDNDGLACESLP